MNYIDFNLVNDTEYLVDDKLLLSCAEKVLEEELPGKRAELNLLLCDDEVMQNYNRTFRGDNSVTDVLCFNYYDSILNTENDAFPSLYCDIIIDIKQLERQKGNKSMEDELIEIFIHGLLHALGYDHIRLEDRTVMEEKEKYYINKIVGDKTSG